MYWPKHCEYINEDKDNSPNILSDKNLQKYSHKKLNKNKLTCGQIKL